MKETYDEAITQVFQDEGGYSNDAGDPGGPTNWGITIADARMYWKPNATASDVRNMPKSVAEDIYRKHYAAPLQYDLLPPGVDYGVLDFGINSGDSRSVRFLQKIVGVPMDGQMGPATIAATNKKDPKETINELYDARMAFLRSLGTWSIFGRGWSARCNNGRKLALALVDKYPVKQVSTATKVATGALIAAVGTGASVHAFPHISGWLIAACIAFTVLAILFIGKHFNANNPKTVVT